MAGGACMAGKTAIAAGGTHPTGMHSCSFFRTNFVTTPFSVTRILSVFRLTAFTGERAQKPDL